MNEELTETIYKPYPELYSEKDLPMSVSTMCWGFSHDDGWFEIVAKMSSELDAVRKNRLPDLKVQQVKEKFGLLRVYLSHEDEELRDIVSRAEAASSKTCELCGEVGSLRTAGWAKTLCGKHREY